jgi:hypothetical protein
MKRAEDRASAAIQHQLIARRGNGFGKSIGSSPLSAAPSRLRT